MSKYYQDFMLVSQSYCNKREEYIKAFALEGDELEEEVYPALETVLIPDDFIELSETQGGNALRYKGIDITLADDGMLRDFYIDYGHYQPSAFLIATNSLGELYVYSRGDSGIGLYRTTTGSCEPEGDFLAPSFTDLFIHGNGIEKLLED